MIRLLFVFFLPLFLVAQPGKPLIVKDFALEGNRKTKDKIIIRSTGILIGDTISSEGLEELGEKIRVNVSNLQLFASVQVQPIDLGDGYLLFLITVEERWYTYPSPIIQLAEPNFNTWWKNRKNSRTNYGIRFKQFNFRGRDETLSMKLKLGYTREFILQYKIPFLSLEKNMGLDFHWRYREFDEINVGTIDNQRIFYRSDNNNTRKEQVLGFGVSSRPDIYHRYRLGIAWEDVLVKDSVNILYPDHLDGQEKMQFLRLSATQSYTRFDRNGYPSRGIQIENRVEKKGLGIFTKAPDILELYSTFRGFLPLGQRWNIQHRSNIKYTALGSPAYYLQRGLGYRKTNVRSYEFYIVDGQDYYLGRNNLNYALIPEKKVKVPKGTKRFIPSLTLGLHANLIFDVGYVRDELHGRVNPLSNEFLMGTGLGLDLITNYDTVFRFEYTINRANESGLYLHYRRAI